MSNLPERINAMRVVSYDVHDIAKSVCEMDDSKTLETVTIDDVLDYIRDWLGEDFGCRYGHQNDISDLILQDENGNDL